MKFGKKLQDASVPEWREYYMGYKRLKRVIKKTELRRIRSTNASPVPDKEKEKDPTLAEKQPLLATVDESFESALEHDIILVDNFFLSKLTEAKYEYGELLAEFRQGGATPSPGPSTSRFPVFLPRRRADDSPEERLLSLYDRVQKLEEFSRVNQTGFRKIVKKYDKATGGDTLKQLQARMERTHMHRCDEDIHHLLKEINLLYMQITNDPTHSAKEILAEQANSGGLFKVHVAWKWKPLLFGAIVFVVLLCAPILNPEQYHAQRCLAMLAFITVLWVTEAVPYFVAALMIPVLSVLLRVYRDEITGTALPAEQAVEFVLSKMFNHTTALILGGFAISCAFSKYGFELILASFIVNRLQRYPRIFLLAMMFLCAFLSMWISNVAAPLLCTSIISPILHDLPRRNRYLKALLLGLAFSGNIGGMLTPISSPQNAVALGIYNNFVRKEGEDESQISFLSWMMVAGPNGVFLLLAAWVFLLVAVRPNDCRCLPDVIFDRKPFTIFHYIVLCTSFATIILWCTQSVNEVIFGNMGFIALLPLVVFLSIGVLTKHDFRERFAWDLVFLISGGNVLGAAIKSSSLLQLLADPIADLLDEARLSVWVLTIIFSFISLLVCSAISHTVGAIILTPLICAIGQPLGVENMQPMIVGATLMYSGAGALPMSSFPNINSLMMEDDHEQKYLDPVDFIKYGGPFSVLCFLVTVSWGYMWMLCVF